MLSVIPHSDYGRLQVTLNSPSQDNAIIIMTSKNNAAQPQSTGNGTNPGNFQSMRGHANKSFRKMHGSKSLLQLLISPFQYNNRDFFY